MSLVPILCIIIEILSIALITAIIVLLAQRKALKEVNQQLAWINMSTR